MWKGYFYMILLVVLNLIKTIMNSQYFYGLGLIGLRIRSALTSALFKKALILGPSARKELTSNYDSFFANSWFVCGRVVVIMAFMINCHQNPQTEALNSFIERALCLLKQRLNALHNIIGTILLALFPVFLPTMHESEIFEAFSHDYQRHNN